MQIVNEDLKRSLSAAKKRPHNFALVVGHQLGLLLSKTKIGGAALKEKQLECGGGTIVRGRCFLEDGVMVFETANKVSSTFGPKIKKLIKDEVGLTLAVLLRQKEKVEEIEDDSDETEAEDHAETALRPKAKVKEIEDDEAEAEERVEAVRAPEVPKQAPPPTKPSIDGEAIFKERLKKLMPTILEAEAAHPELKAELGKMVAEAHAAAKANHLPEMKQQLEDLEGTVEAILRSSRQSAEHVEHKWAGLQPSFDKAVELSRNASTGDDAILVALFKEFESQKKAKHWDDADAKLDQLAARVKSSLRTALAKQEIGAAGPNLVRYKTFRLRWAKAKSLAQSELQRVADDILADEDVQSDPRFPEFQAKALELPKLFPRFDHSLEDALDAVDGATDPAEKAKAKQNAIKILAAYQKLVDGEPLLKEFENSPLGKTSIHAEMATLLAEIKAILSK